jgi:hypothetical protein
MLVLYGIRIVECYVALWLKKEGLQLVATIYTKGLRLSGLEQ